MKGKHGFALLLATACLAIVAVRVEAVTLDEKKSKLTEPAEQQMMLGKWAIEVTYAPTEEMPKGAKGRGTEIWHLGPGGNSLIEEYHESGDAGDYDAMGPAWWDEKEKGRRFLWCDSAMPTGCELSRSVARWENGRLFYSEEREDHGEKIERREIFLNIVANSFDQVIEEGPIGGPYKPQVTIHAVRIGAASKDLALQDATAERLRANKEGDVAAIERLMAPDYLQMDISGHVQNKETWLAEYFRPLAKLIQLEKFHWVTFDEDDVRVRMLDDTAIQAGTLTLKGVGAKPVRGVWEEAPGATIQITIRFTRTWIWRDGGWQLLMLHNAVQSEPTAK